MFYMKIQSLIKSNQAAIYAVEKTVSLNKPLKVSEDEYVGFNY